MFGILWKGAAVRFDDHVSRGDIGPFRWGAFAFMAMGTVPGLHSGFFAVQDAS